MDCDWNDIVIESTERLRAALFELARAELDRELARKAAGKRWDRDYVAFLYENLRHIQNAKTIWDLANAPWIDSATEKGRDTCRYGEEIPDLDRD
jgi:hypothetical protein